jgi:cysteine desulfurase/selenocysteine lyase
MEPLHKTSSAAITQCIVDYYSRYNANIHRGVHALSQRLQDMNSTFKDSKHLMQKNLSK